MNLHQEASTNVDAERSQRAPSVQQPRAIAIDGPVAAGKSAVGALVARRLGYRFVDTGMMYRAITWLALERRVDLNDERALTDLAEHAEIAIESDTATPERGRVVIDGTDVSDTLRSASIGEAVSLVSRVPGVRAALVARQRELAGQGGVVMAGRDIGTVVLPDAPLKVYLDASREERVRRRHDELIAAGRTATLEDVGDELALRDRIDSERDVSPLRPADDAVVIDTDHLTLDEVVERICELLPCRS